MVQNAAVGRQITRATSDADHSHILFGPDSQSNLSHVLQVENDPVAIRAFNLADGDEVLVEMVGGDGAGTLYAPFCPINGQATLTNVRNVLPIGISGRYRFVLQRSDGGTPPVGQVTVMSARVSMSHEWLSAYMQCAAKAG